MMVALSLEADADARQIIEQKTQLTEKAVGRAEVRAINKTLRWLRTQVLRAVSQQSGIPQRYMRARFQAPVKAKKGRPIGKFWAGLAGVDPMSLGKTGRRTAQGYRVGRFFFEDAFRAYYSARWGGLGSLYKRKSNERLPIERQYIPIDTEVKQALERLLPRANRELFKKLRQELNFELVKAGKAA